MKKEGKKVYELAREYNIPVKELIQQLKRLDIPVNNHMTTISYEDIRKFEQSKKGFREIEIDGELVLETRVKRTVIRRRRKETVVKEPQQEQQEHKDQEQIKLEQSDENLKEKEYGGQKGKEEQLKIAKLVKADFEQEKKQFYPDQKPLRDQDKRKFTKDKKSFVKKTTKKHKTTKPVIKTNIKLERPLSLVELSKLTGVPKKDLISKAKSLGLNVAELVNLEDAQLLLLEFGIEATINVQESSAFLRELLKHRKNFKQRPPIVTVMGHVDHGKTTLLDAIRSTNVVQKEFGGITQHIGAYKVKIGDFTITFIDTPGHESFTQMRAKGVSCTDIVVLVVAADDGVKPQTVEAINHAKAANVPIIVAINKIDKPGVNKNKVIQDLARYDIVPEGWGGDNLFVEVSALKKQGIDELLEAIKLQAEMLDLKAYYDGDLSIAYIIESKVDKGLGPLISVVVKEGTIKKGDTLVVEDISARLRTIIDENNQRLDKITPSFPAQLVGLPRLPEKELILYAFKKQKDAQKYLNLRALQKEFDSKKSSLVLDEKFILENLSHKKKELNLIIKADVAGTLEAIKDSVLKLSNDDIKVKVVHYGLGDCTESDIYLAESTGSFILLFNVKISSSNRKLAKSKSIQFKVFNIIYDVIDYVKEKIEKLNEPKLEQVMIGKAIVKQVYKIKKNIIAGVQVTEGKIKLDSQVSLLRSDNEVASGKIISLKRYKDDVKIVEAPLECGIVISNVKNIQVGDEVLVYEYINK